MSLSMDDNNRYYDVNSQLKCTDEEINRSLRSFHTKVFIQLNEEFLFFLQRTKIETIYLLDVLVIYKFRLTSVDLFSSSK